MDASRILAERSGTKKAIFLWIQGQYDQETDFASHTIDLTSIMTEQDKAEGLIPSGFPIPKKNTSGEYESIPEDARDAKVGKNLILLEVTFKKENGNLYLEFVGHQARSEVRRATDAFQNLFRDLLLSDKPNAPAVNQRIAEALQLERQQGRSVEDVLADIRVPIFGYLDGVRIQIASRLAAISGSAAFDIIRLFEEYGLPIAFRDAATILDILNFGSPVSYSEIALGQARDILDSAAGEKLVIEYRLSEQPMAEQDKTLLLEELLTTAQNFMIISPRSEVRFIVRSRSEEGELRRSLGRLNQRNQSRTMGKGISIFNTSSSVNLLEVYDSPDLILTMDPKKALRQSPTVSAFDLGYFADGSPTSGVTPAQFLSGSIAALLKDKVIEGIARTEHRIIQFQDERAAAGFNLFIQVLAQQARAEVRAAASA